MATTTVIKDVVCGMEIDVNSATTKSEYKGRAYYFCSSSCKSKFDKAPESFLQPSGDKAASSG